MGLEIVILSEIGQRMTSIIMLSTYFVQSQSRNDTNGLIYYTEQKQAHRRRE